MQEKGRYHDTQNNAQFVNLIPAWVVEEAEEKDSANGSSDLEKMSHIVGAYFDKLYLQISAIPGLRHEQSTSSSYKPLQTPNTPVSYTHLTLPTILLV